MQGLEIIDTNSEEDFSLSGNLIYYTLGAIVLSLLIFLMLYVGLIGLFCFPPISLSPSWPDDSRSIAFKTGKSQGL